MSEQVEITGVAWSGNLREWSTEKTQADILAVLKSTMQMNQEQAKALNGILRSVSGGKAGKAAKGDKDSAASSLAAFTNGVTSSTKANKDHSKSVTKGTKGIKSMVGAALKSNALWIAAGAAGTLLKTVMDELTNAFFSQVNNYDLAYKAGIDFTDAVDDSTNGFRNMASLADTLNMKYTTMVGVMSTFSVAISKFGERNFVKVIKSTSDDMLQFGMSTVETTEYLGRYLDQRQSFDISTKMTQQSLQTSFVDSMAMVTKWSMTLGKSREAILSDLDKTLKSETLTAFMSDIADPDMKKKIMENVSQVTAAFGDPRISDMLIEMMTSSIPESSQAYADLQKSGLYDMASTAIEFSKMMKEGSIDYEVAHNMVTQLAAVTKNNVFSTSDLSSKFAGEASAYARTMTIAARDAETRMHATSIAENETGATMARMRNAMTQLSTVWEKIVGSIIGTESGFARFTDMLNYATEFIDKYSVEIAEFVNVVVNWIMEKLKAVFAFFDDEANGKTFGEKIQKFISVTFSSIGKMIGEAILEGIKSALGFGPSDNRSVAEQRGRGRRALKKETVDGATPVDPKVIKPAPVFGATPVDPKVIKPAPVFGANEADNRSISEGGESAPLKATGRIHPVVNTATELRRTQASTYLRSRREKSEEREVKAATEGSDTKRLEAMNSLMATNLTALMEQLVEINKDMLGAMTEGNSDQKKMTRIINNKDRTV